jgi:hypothetical protein
MCLITFEKSLDSNSHPTYPFDESRKPRFASRSGQVNENKINKNKSLLERREKETTLQRLIIRI